jgi:hypothetical protein
MQRWRVGRKVPINVYEGERPVCQCHTPEMAQRIVDAMNATANKASPSAAREKWMEEAADNIAMRLMHSASIEQMREFATEAISIAYLSRRIDQVSG